MGINGAQTITNHSSMDASSGIANHSPCTANITGVQTITNHSSMDTSPGIANHSPFAVNITSAQTITKHSSMDTSLGIANHSVTNYVCCCKAWKETSASCKKAGKETKGARKKPGILAESGTKCCIELNGKCNRIFGYTQPYDHTLGPCPDSAISSTRDAHSMPSHTADTDRVKAEIRKLEQQTKITEPWDNGYMAYLSIGNAGRAAGTAVTNVAAEQVGQVLTETVGAQAAPVAIVIGAATAFTTMVQINKAMELMNKDLALQQKQYLECTIENLEVNVGVTVVLIGIAVSSLVGAIPSGGVSAVAGAAVATGIILLNKERNKYQCKTQSDDLKAWLLQQQEQLFKTLCTIQALADAGRGLLANDCYKENVITIMTRGIATQKKTLEAELAGITGGRH